MAYPNVLKWNWSASCSSEQRCQNTSVQLYVQQYIQNMYVVAKCQVVYLCSRNHKHSETTIPAHGIDHSKWRCRSVWSLPLPFTPTSPWHQAPNVDESNHTTPLINKLGKHFVMCVSACFVDKNATIGFLMFMSIFAGLTDNLWLLCATDYNMERRWLLAWPIFVVVILCCCRCCWVRWTHCGGHIDDDAAGCHPQQSVCSITPFSPPL